MWPTPLVLLGAHRRDHCLSQSEGLLHTHQSLNLHEHEGPKKRKRKRNKNRTGKPKNLQGKAPSRYQMLAKHPPGGACGVAKTNPGNEDLVLDRGDVRPAHTPDSKKTCSSATSRKTKLLVWSDRRMYDQRTPTRAEWGGPAVSSFNQELTGSDLNVDAIV